MKVRKIESLKKNVYLIDGYDELKEAVSIRVDRFGVVWGVHDDSSEELIGNIESGNWKLLGKLKDLTEEQLKPLVDSWESVAKDGTMVYENYKDSIPKKRNSEESFLSALEAKDVLFKNPYQNDWDELCEWGFVAIDGQTHTKSERYENAKQNVFSGETLVFIES